MKFNSLKHSEVLSDLTENIGVRQNWHFISYILLTIVNYNAQGPTLLLPRIPLQQHTFVKQDTQAELLQSEICNRNMKKTLQFSLHLNKTIRKVCLHSQIEQFQL